MSRSFQQISIFFWLLFSAANTHAQPLVGIEESPIIEFKEKRTVVDFFNYADHAIGCIMEKKNNWTGAPAYYMNIYSKHLQPLAEKKLDLKRYGNRLQYEAMVHIGDSLYIISSYDNQKKKKKFIFAQSMDRKAFEFHNDLKMIASFPLTNQKRNKNEKLLYKQSPDKSKIVFYLSHNVKFKDNYQIDFVVLNNHLEFLWQKKFTLPENKKEKKLSRIANSEVNYDPKDHPYQLIINNNAKIYINRKTSRFGETNIYLIDKNTPKGSKLNIAPDTSRYIPHFNIIAGEKNTLFGTAYQQNNPLGNGIFHVVWDSTKRLQESYVELPLSLSKFDDNYQFEIKYMYRYSNGMMGSIAEFHKEKLHRSGNTKNEQLYYNFNDIIISQYLNETNELKYHQIVKNQKGDYSALPYLSYGMVNFTRGVGLFYYAENPVRTSIKVLEYTEVNEQGEIKKQRLNIPHQESIKTPLRVSDIWQFDATHAVVYQIHNKKMKLYMIHAID